MQCDICELAENVWIRGWEIDGGRRFQHGENPEHSLVIEGPFAARGSKFTDWLEAIHGLAAQS